MQQKIFVENQVGGLRINVIGTEQIIFFLPVLEQVIHSRRSLLVYSLGGVENVLGQFFAFVLHRVE